MFDVRRRALSGALSACLVGLAAQASAQAPPPARDQAPPPATVAVSGDDGRLTLATADGRFKWTLEGRLMVDAAAFGGATTPLSDGIEIRRARVGVSMVLWSDWSAKIELDFADNETAIKDVWIAYAASPRSFVKAGQFTEPLCLEQINSSRYTTFVERSLIAGLVPDRHVGVAYSRWGERWQATGGVFGEAVGRKDLTGDNEGFDLTGRVTSAPVLSAAHVLHVGLAASRRTPPAAKAADLSDRQQWRFQLRPETHVSRAAFLDTGVIGQVDHLVQVGTEAAMVWGPWSVQAEYLRTALARTGGQPTAVLTGWYAYATWFVTGEHRPYRAQTGDFGRLTPRGRGGAVELLARYSTASLDDANAGVSGGTEHITTAGVNWHFNPSLRLGVNALRVVNGANATGLGRYPPGARFTAIQARLQVQF
jgi:phosphate-selective porin OprO/OprP